jgi:membrane fusion protein, copper/silver efflux system
MKRRRDKIFFLLALTAFLFGCKDSKKQLVHNDAHSYHKGIAQLIVSPAQQVLSRQSTVKLSEQQQEQTIKAEGYIDLDKNRNESVAARFGGRIEKLYVRYNLQQVKKGERILNLYSPEINTYQEEHLLLIRTRAGNSLIEKSRERLRLLGITASQIAMLEKTGAVTQTISVYSPADGYVLFDVNQSPGQRPSSRETATQGMNMNPAAESKQGFPLDRSQIREGDYVNNGQVLFSINDLKTVWAVVSVPNTVANTLQVNRAVEIHSELIQGKTLTGKIVLIEPSFEEEEQRFSRTRILLVNKDGRLKLNSVLSAEIEIPGREGFHVPVSAVYRTGLNAYVWVKAGHTEKGTGIFELKKVTIGTVTNDMASITSGLSANDEIAKEAGMMTDSETLLRVKQ